MLITEEFRKKNQELQKILLDEIYKAESGVSSRNIHQLRSILKDLLMMERRHGVALSFPHIIVDSWDYTDELGKKLMELASIYEKVNASSL